ncbi:SufE family protein [Rubrivirga sp. S365]|uniref:SufE family protein n=1 Tax=Rubrivirga sp. S365 TaxID=3076080 RepID=UPI0028C6B0BF|nr:SufE family protein [Rubrivirga sp. S365]MDT7855146.1 SufE family protein [Rubrivirga sp. S365]
MNARLQEIADELASVPPEMQVELLLEHARQFPPLPEKYQAARDAGLGRVHECQAEVYFFPEVEPDAEGGAVRIHADIPGHAPTQRALVGILMEAYDGAPPAEVADIPDDLLRQLGVAKLLGVQRQRGFAGVLARLKHGVAEAAADPDGDASGGVEA